MGRYNSYLRHSTYNDWFHTAATGGISHWPQHAISLDDVYTISPSTVLNVRYSFYRLSIGQTPNPQSVGFDLTKLGLPQSLNDATGAGQRAFPYITIDGYAETANSWYAHNHQNHNLETHLSTMRGGHFLRFGGDVRQYNTFEARLNNSSTAAFQFGNDWTNGPFNTSPSAPIGQGLASMLLGLPTGGWVDRNASYAERSREYSVYVQDDWRATPRLTLNFGARWEGESPMTERYNRSVEGYDFQTANPLEAQARANYALNPIAELPSDQFRFTGGLTFPGVNGRSANLWNPQWTNVMPRAGFAYSLGSKTVIRGGYGLFYGPLGARRTDVNQAGFNQSTPLIPSLDNGLTFVATVNNPFPNGIQAPPGAKDGLLTSVGRDISFFNPNPQAPRQQRWELSFQRVLPNNILFDAAYVGNHGSRLETGSDLRPLPTNYLSRAAGRDQANADYLWGAVANPYYGLLPDTNLSGQTVSRSYLLRTGDYSGFTSVSSTDYLGYSNYDSLQVKVEKRFAAGWSLNAGYSWSKYMEAIDRVNGYLDALNYIVSDQDRPQRIVLSGTWELPFGHGKHFLSTGGVVDKIVGDWQFSGIYTGQGGQAVDWWSDV